MGKNIWVEDEDEERFQSSHPGCMWGVIHALNYHHWNYNNVKKMVFSHSHNRTRRGKGNRRHKTITGENGESEKLSDVEPRRFFVDESTTSSKTCSTNRKSIRARIKALITDEISKEGSHKQKGPTKSQLRRTYSIHYLDPSVLGPRGEGNAESNKLHEECPKKTLASSILSTKDDVLELFRVNQDLFQEYLESTNDSTEDLQTSNKLARNLRPSKLKSKQEETWPFPREEKFLSGARAQKFDILKDLSTKSGPITLGRSSSSCDEIYASMCDLNKKISKHRRTLSLNESMERYTQLLETGSSREGNKLHQSKSLRLGKEHEISFKRVRSLSHSDTIWTLQNGLFSDAVSDMIVEKISESVENDPHSESQNTALPESTGIYLSPSAEEEMEAEESNLEEKVTFGDCVNNLEQTAPDFLNQTCSEDDILYHSEYATSEDLEHGCVDMDANELSNVTCSLEDLEEFYIVGYRAEPNAYDTDGFNFVRAILNKSGLEGSSFIEQWYSLDQPLNPLVFDEVEASWPHEEPQYYLEKKYIDFHHHQVLFGLINEVLVQIYDSSLSYYPKALSSSCHLRPLPPGQHFAEEVWARISKITSIRPEVDEIASYGYPKDLGKDDGWINLQFETECVGLELEDWIFEELLEEVLCSSDD